MLQRQGFCVSPVPLLSRATCCALQERLPKLFAGDFETGVYPDEWHWRQGIGKENGVTREMCNVWKSDRLVASIVLKESMGKLVSEVLDWPSVRIAQDDVIWKPPAVINHDTTNTVVGFHQDSAYISSQFEPFENNSVTVWMAVDDTDEETGCLQYVAGSHLRENDGHESLASVNEDAPSFHGATAESYKESLPFNSREDIISVPVAQGHAIFHHQDVWHGSGPNRSSTRHRRALVGHYLRGDVQFKHDRGGNDQTPWGQTDYIYGRYKRYQSVKVDESFFPIIYAAPGHGQSRTMWLDEYTAAHE